MEKIVKQGKLEDGIYYLPNITLDRKEYLELAKHLEFLGGKWKGGKIKGFIFDRKINTIEELLGNNIKVKKDIQLFETPESIVELLISYSDVNDKQTYLEPSAGRGKIIRGIQKYCSCYIDYCEINEVNRDYLKNIDNINYLTDDFLKLKTNKRYSRIIANPPFSKNQDIDHIMKMYDLLDDNGILVSVSSKHWELSSNKKETEFRRFLDLVRAETIDLDSGEFKESGTLVSSKIIIIKKSPVNNSYNPIDIGGCTIY